MSESGDTRLEQLSIWLTETLSQTVNSIESASSDASFRRYFRVVLDRSRYIAMDAPPPREDVRPFIRIARMLAAAGIHVPHIHHADESNGFLLLDDFGATCYLDGLAETNVDVLYDDAMETLVSLQRNIHAAACDLPLYDEKRLRTEMDLFRDWFLRGLLGIEMAASATAVLESVWRILTASALEQPKVCVHRDYHSRNLMILQDRNPGVLDFQDAVVGPITYDPVSLLRDCYIAWPAAWVESWSRDYYRRVCDAGLMTGEEPERWQRWFDLMGVQRHLKAIGIFSRLKLRDGKAAYLKHIPRTLSYVSATCQRYPLLSGFADILQQDVLPRAGETLQEAAA